VTAGESEALQLESNGNSTEVDSLESGRALIDEELAKVRDEEPTAAVASLLVVMAEAARSMAGDNKGGEKVECKQVVMTRESFKARRSSTLHTSPSVFPARRSAFGNAFIRTLPTCSVAGPRRYPVDQQTCKQIGKRLSEGSIVPLNTSSFTLGVAKLQYL
jgi:hypothetical protein